MEFNEFLSLCFLASIFQFLVHYLYLRQSMETSILQKRLHHQLNPMRVDCENGYEHDDILAFLRSKGHEVRERAPIVLDLSKLNVRISGMVHPRACTISRLWAGSRR